jgi:plastocyanin
MKLTKLIFAVSVLVLLGLGCSPKQDKPNVNANTPAVGTSRAHIASGTMSVKIKPDGEFDPVTAFVKKGTIVTFMNDSTKPHSIIPQEDAGKKFAGLDSRGEFAPGGSFTVTMDQVGRWLFQDSTNPAFGGAIEVAD